MREMICIHQGVWIQLHGPRKGEAHGFFGPKYGEIVTVSQCPNFKDSFRVHEYPLDPDGNVTSFSKRWFAVAADISELTEILEAKPELA
jgi:hypothetical protein